MDQPQNFQILSLDGGGIKGIFSAAVLAAIEEDLNVKITDHFDLIAGTSTGGIIALGLGLGLRPKEIVEFYTKEGPNIFGSWPGPFSWGKSIRGLLFAKYSQGPLRDALVSCFKEKTLGESVKRLVIPSYSLGEDDVHIFKTAHHEKLRNNYKLPAWKVALATSAAPTFFPVCRDIASIRLVDGGVWANNPLMVALLEANAILKIPYEKISALSIGTSNAIPNRKRYLNWGGLLQWGMSGAAVDILMKGQSVGALNQAKFILGDENVIRIDPSVASGEFSLDGAHSASELIGKAAHYARAMSTVFAKRFRPHTAAPFTPFYKLENTK